MYMTLFAGSPCPKTVSFPRNSATFLRRPAESRNDCTSNAGILNFLFCGERETLTDARLAAEDTMRQNSMQFDSAHCSILNSACRFTQPLARTCTLISPWILVNYRQSLSGPAEPSATTGALP